MDELIKWIKNLLAAWPGYLIIILIVVVFCIAKVENLILIKSFFFALFKTISHSARKGHIANSIRGSVLKAAKKSELSSLGVLPNDLKIKWVDCDTPESFFADGQVVIRVKQDENPNINFVRILTQFVNTGLFQNSRHYFDSTLLEAADLVIAQDIIAETRPTAHKEFYETIYAPAISERPKLKQDYDALSALHKSGIFYLIYLNELNKVQAQVIGQEPDPCLIAESREMMNFLNDIIQKVSDDPDNLNINNNYFQFGLVYAISNKTLWYAGHKAHLKVIKKLVENNYRTVYVLAAGRKCDSAKDIAYKAKKELPEIVSSSTHKYRARNVETGKKTEGICIELNTY